MRCVLRYHRRQDRLTAAEIQRITLFSLSYDVAVIQQITSCHKNHTTTRVITRWREPVTSLTTSVSTMRFLIGILFILKAIKSQFKGSYDKQNLTLVVILYEIYEMTARSASFINFI